MPSMPANRISATLSAEDTEAIMQAIETIRTKLPFLIDLTREERRTIVKLGDKSRGFVFKMLELLHHHSDFLPRSFDITEMEKDVELFRGLYGISIAINQLNQLVESTLMEVGSEAYMAALVAYHYVKDANLEGVDEILDDIARRFARRSRDKGEQVQQVTLAESETPSNP